MKLEFYKYHGTGNDFIIIDNRKKKFNGDRKQIAHLCHRKFGIGADGLMLLQNKEGFDFEMVYFNSDGNESSFCGNGGRCIAAFAKKLNVIKKQETTFSATDGIHTAAIRKETISIRMKDVNDIESGSDFYLLNTGSPHYVKFANQVGRMDILPESKKIRYSKRFTKKGVNVNFAEKKGNHVFVRTYERGVENETLSCGTGVTATAIAAAVKSISTSKKHCKISTLGGELTVRFRRGNGNSFSDIWLEGPATYVFKGELEL
ncbi:MAG TPA: diaminopimelate epimerase [Bacteroidia bacterium]